MRACLLLLLLVMACGGGGDVSLERHSSGLFALVIKGNDINEKVLELDFVKGAVVRIPWRDVEPQKGQFDFSYIDRQLALVSKHDKLLSLTVIPGFLSPTWVLDEVPTLTFKFDELHEGEHHVGHPKPLRGQDSQRLPVLWSDEYLTCWEAFIKKLGQRYAGHPNLVAINLTGPNGGNGEVALPRSKADLKVWRQNVKNARDLSDKMVGAYRRCFKAFITAFPKQEISMAPILDSLPLGDRDDKWAYKEALVAMGLEHRGHFALQTNGLNAKGRLRHWELIKKNVGIIPTGFQTRVPKALFGEDNPDAASRRQTLTTILGIADEHKVKWIEFYESTLLDEDLQDLLRAWLPVSNQVRQ